MSVNLAKGVRDFLPEQMHHRLHVIGVIREIFTRFGFEPLETPAFERIETLTGKYGDEGDRLVFKILSRGEGGKAGEVDQALRYDLTVPLARVVAMHPELKLPFKRYQMQPVWRAERSQRGRFREFWQCDVDIAGSTSALAEAECLAVATAAMGALGFDDYFIRVNDRRILRSLATAAGAEDRETGVLVALDKLDKIGRDGVTKALVDLGLAESGISALFAALDVPAGNRAALAALAGRLDARGQEGVARLHEVLDATEAFGLDERRIRIDPTLARGLDYYTGPVFEIALPEGGVGSVGGGGRYDGLVGMFSGRAVPAVGISLGIERLMVVMEERGKAQARRTSAQVFVTVFDAASRAASLKWASTLRDAGVPTDVFLGDGKLGNQLKYADARGYPYALVLGPDEIARGEATLRDLATGAQSSLAPDVLVAHLRGAVSG